MVSFSKALNTATMNSKIFVAGSKPLVTHSKVLNATSGYTPAVGDVLVKNTADSDSDNVWDHDDVYTKNVGTLVGAVGTLTNTTPIIPRSIRIYSDTAYTTELTQGVQYSVNNAIPATVDISLSGSAAITLSAAFSFEFLEEGNQEIQGVIYEIDSSDTAAITLHFASEGYVHYTAIGTDGTAAGTYKTSSKNLLISKLKDIGIEVDEA